MKDVVVKKKGRPPINGKPMVKMFFRIPKEHKEILDKYPDTSKKLRYFAKMIVENIKRTKAI